MQRAYGLAGFALLAVLFWSGCSRNDSSDYRQYSSDDSSEVTLDSDTTPGKSLPQATKTNRNQIATSSPNEPSDWTAGMPAAVGFGSGIILSETFRLSGEYWLTPAVGAGPTRVRVQNVSPKIVKLAAKPRKVQILIKEKTFRMEGPEGAVRISYDDIDLLKVLNMDPVTPDAPEKMPNWLKNLDGKRVRIRGFMSPAFRQTGLAGFLMGRDNKACCFPGRAKIYDLFPVKLRKGVTTDYIQNRPFDVAGVFEIKTWVEGGELLQLYQIIDAVVVQ